MLIHDKFYCEGNDNFGKFHDITSKLTKRQSVEFALYCAKDVYHLVDKENEEVAKPCINLVEKWLVDEKSVTSEELRDVASNAVWSAASVWAVNASASAAYADAAAGWASWAAWAASAAYDATVQSAGWAADAAVDAVRAYNTFGSKKYNEKSNEYLIIVNSYFTKTNINCPNYEIEGKILYLIDELDENIFIKVKNKYYINMNGIENCPEYGFDTQQELLNELFNSKCLFWVFVRNWLDQLYKGNNNVDS